jgi:hypothetical protein
VIKLDNPNRAIHNKNFFLYQMHKTTVDVYKFTLIWFWVVDPVFKGMALSTNSATVVSSQLPYYSSNLRNDALQITLKVAQIRASKIYVQYLEIIGGILNTDLNYKWADLTDQLFPRLQFQMTL